MIDESRGVEFIPIDEDCSVDPWNKSRAVDDEGSLSPCSSDLDAIVMDVDASDMEADYEPPLSDDCCSESDENDDEDDSLFTDVEEDY